MATILELECDAVLLWVEKNKQNCVWVSELMQLTME